MERVKKKIWIVSELFFPEETSTAYIMTAIADKLTEEFEVNVICCKSLYEQKTNSINNESKLNPKIKIKRISSLNLNKNVVIKRFLNSIFISINILIKVVVNSKKNETLLIVTNPFILIPFISLIAHLKKLKLNILVHDVFPENLIAIDFFKENNFFYKLLKKVFDISYASADSLIVLGKDMNQIIQRKIGSENSYKIKIIENWTDNEVVFPIRNINKSELYNLKIPFEDKIVFQFAGNLGRMQGLLEIVEIFKEVKNKNLVLILIGEGALKKSLIASISNSDHIYILPSFPRKMQNYYINACDIGVVSIEDKMFGLGVPSKSYNIIGANKPILFIGNRESEISQMVIDNNLGWSFEFKQKKEIINFLNKLEKNNLPSDLKIHKFATANYSKKEILNKFKFLNNFQ